MYDKSRLSSATPCASGLVVLPTRLNEGQIQELAGWFQRAVTKSVRDSTWFSNGSVYHESTMALYKRARPLSKERKRASNSNGPAASPQHDGPPGPQRQNAGPLQADVVGLDGVLLEGSKPADDGS